MMKRKIAWLLTLVLLAVNTPAAWSEADTPLAAFQKLAEIVESPAPDNGSADAILDKVMSGSYAAAATDEERALLAAELPALCAVTDKNLASYASQHGCKMAQVRNAYYQALAHSLQAEIQLHPAEEGNRHDVQAILSTFLELNDDNASLSQRNDYRDSLTNEDRSAISSSYSLPSAFVDFLILDEHWNDGDWKNDDQWLTRNGAGTAVIGEVLVGSRDTQDSTLIADMQEKLIALGYLQGKANGVFSLRTQKALLEFQAANGLTPSGIYNDLAHEKLMDDDAVARWDYSVNFWDTDDMNDTPDTPDKKDTPDKNTPDTPDKTDTPDTPDPTPKPTKKKTVTKTDTPDSPDTPDPTPKPTKKTTTKKTATPKPTKKPATTKADSPDSPDSPDTPDPTPKPKK